MNASVEAPKREGVVRHAGMPKLTPKERESADMAIALSRKVGDNYYQGTVPYAEVQHRRARNRVARHSRAINRKK